MKVLLGAYRVFSCLFFVDSSLLPSLLDWLKVELSVLKERIGFTFVQFVFYQIVGWPWQSRRILCIMVVDTKQDYNHSQEIDIFRYVAGISFSKDTEAFFVGVADCAYSSLLEFNRSNGNTYLDSYFWGVVWMLRTSYRPSNRGMTCIEALSFRVDWAWHVAFISSQS